MDLFQYLREFAKNQSTIRLLNVYKGLPVSYDAQIRLVGDAEIQVHANRFQLACLYHQQETYLQAEMLPSIVHSQVASLHLGKEDATLIHLEVAHKNIGNRSQIRVEPDGQLFALIQFNGAPMGLAAPIADISVEGASVYLEPYMFSPRLCQPGNPVSISITLPDTLSQKLSKPVLKPTRDDRAGSSFNANESMKSSGTVVLTTTGKVISVRSQLVRYRVGMKLIFKDLSRMVIQQYIAQRQSEIIRELTELSDELFSRKK